MSIPSATGAGSDQWAVRCRSCGEGWPLRELRWRCTCGGLLDLDGPPADASAAGASAADASAAGASAADGSWWQWSLWRYHAVLPPLAVAGAARITMGEGATPLIPATLPEVWLKFDHLMPTLSFKDRGAAVLLAAAAEVGVGRAVTDSSGNAGAAVAAYAARAGIEAEVFVPAATSKAKRAAIARYGATLHVVAGSRADAAAAAQERVAAGGTFYASHVFQPLFVHGTKTCAYELWQQLGGRAPGTVVVATGNGTMVLGLRLGFAELAAAGLIHHQPAIVAVQAERCAPLAGLVPSGPTAAEGIAIVAPPRAEQILEAVRGSRGAVILAAEDALPGATSELASRGIDVEPTAAAVWAAWSAWEGAPTAAGPVVLVLGGAGAKRPPPA